MQWWYIFWNTHIKEKVLFCITFVTAFIFGQLRGKLGARSIQSILPKDFTLPWLMMVCLCVSDRSSQSKWQARGAGVELSRLIHSGQQHCGLSERKRCWQTDSALPWATHCRLHHQGGQKYKGYRVRLHYNTSVMYCLYYLGLRFRKYPWTILNSGYIKWSKSAVITTHSV